MKALEFTGSLPSYAATLALGRLSPSACRYNAFLARGCLPRYNACG